MSIKGQRRGLRIVVTIAALAALGSGAESVAEEGWGIRIEPLFVEAYGHDRHVLTVRDGASATDVDVSTDSGPGYHLELRKPAPGWGWGVDFFWFSTPQSVPNRDAAATAAGSPVAFEIPAGSFVSNGPDELLYYRLLEDNDIAAWTLDVYGLKTIRESERRTLRLLAGVRAADFDNDYRAAAGLGTAGGTRLDSSSNYDRMHGPIVGLIASHSRGRHGFELSGSQAIVLGTVDLSSTQSDFVGPFVGEAQAFTDVRTFGQPKDVTIPITELQFKWARELGQRTAFHAGFTAAAWWNVSVPPGVLPTGGQEALDENTIVFFGLLAGIEFGR